MTRASIPVRSAIDQAEAWFAGRLRVTIWGRWVAAESLYLDYVQHVRAPLTRTSFSVWLADTKGVTAKRLRSGETLFAGIDLKGIAA